jgi:hypothetical protein
MLRSAWCVLLLVMAAGCAATPTEHIYAGAKSPATSHCLTSGTRIASREGDCSVPGRSTGNLSPGARATTAAGALHQLDPSIIIRQ